MADNAGKGHDSTSSKRFGEKKNHAQCNIQGFLRSHDSHCFTITNIEAQEFACAKVHEQIYQMKHHTHRKYPQNIRPIQFCQLMRGIRDAVPYDQS